MKSKLLIIILFYLGQNLSVFGSSGKQSQLANCVFIEEPGFPTVETASLSFIDLQSILNSQSKNLKLSKASFSELHKLIIENAKIDLIIWPYGSAITDKVWSDIFKYLQNGGNIIVTGGRPFSFDIDETPEGYKLQRVTNRFTEQLNIFETYTVPINGMKTIVRNPEFDFLPLVRGLRPKQAYSLLTLTGTTKLPENLWGNLSCRFSTILSANDSTGENSIPLISCFDRYHTDFVGGRWVFFTFTPQSGYWQTADGQAMLKDYITYASQKPVEINVVPGYAFYKPGEKADFDIQLKSFQTPLSKFQIEANVLNDGKSVEKFLNISISVEDSLVQLKLKQAVKDGLHQIIFTLKENNKIIEKRIGGFICGDINKLNAGLPFSTNSHFLTRGGKSYPIAGMTYMASEKHRYFLTYPNPIVWDREMKEMKESNINMLRTGMWRCYPYELFMDTKGQPNEKMLRSLDAWLYTAKKYDLPVQYCLFPFQPQVHGSKAPFTDEQAFAVQCKYLAILVQRYKNNPDLIWDIMNEPTYGLDSQFWRGNIPTGTETEKKLWNQWLHQMYGNMLYQLPGKVNILSLNLFDKGMVKLPTSQNFEKSNIYDEGQKPLLAYDYNLFAQFAYNYWAAKIRKIIKEAGSHQLIVTGQDEGGVTNRIQAQFYAETSDFTTQHSWWQDDDLLWDNLMAKTQQKPLLVQETNIMRYTDLREMNRRSELDYMKTLERKICIGLGAEGAGVIPWVWDSNTLLSENESSIGINRCDGTSSPEKNMYKRFAGFVKRNSEYFIASKNPEILLVIPGSLQFTNYQSLALSATKNAVRALHYYARLKFVVTSEYHLERTTEIPKLVILPSAQILSDKAWETLQKWVSEGAILLITGPIECDPHFEPIKRLKSLGVETNISSVLNLNSSLVIGNESFPLEYYNTSAFLYIDKMVWEKDHGKVKKIFLGKGEILITEYPIELNTNLNTTAALYKYAASVARLVPQFRTTCSNNGILIRPIDYEKARMYLLESETDTDESFIITDNLVNKDYTIKLEAGRAKLLLISKQNGEIIDQY